MADFFVRYRDKFRATVLVLMLLIPFITFAAAHADSDLFILLSLGLMAVNMLLAMKAG